MQENKNCYAPEWLRLKDATIKVPKGNKSEYEKMLRDAGFKGRVK